MDQIRGNIMTAMVTNAQPVVRVGRRSAHGEKKADANRNTTSSQSPKAAWGERRLDATHQHPHAAAPDKPAATWTNNLGVRLCESLDRPARPSYAPAGDGTLGLAIVILETVEQGPLASLAHSTHIATGAGVPRAMRARARATPTGRLKLVRARRHAAWRWRHAGSRRSPLRWDAAASW